MTKTLTETNMTRINVGYNPKNLSTRMLIAEHREIKRIPNIVRTGKIKLTDIPDTFRLGTGHVKFFIPRLGYLLKRYKEVYTECLRRGFNVENYESAWHGIPQGLMGDYTPTLRDRRIIEARIRERVAGTWWVQ